MSFWSIIFGAMVMLLVAVFAPKKFNRLVSLIRSLWDKAKESTLDSGDTPTGK